MGDTEIEWTHRPGTVGKTWNPIQGCRRVSPGCQHCYAERIAARFAKDGWSKGLIDLKTRRWNGNARLAKHKLFEPLHWKSPATVFVNSMSDLFYEGFSFEEIAAVFGVMAACPQHTFLVLTKRAKRMREWFEWLAEFSPTGMDIAAILAGLAARALDGQEWRGDAKNEEWWKQAILDFVSGNMPRASWEVNPVSWPLPNVWLGVSVENQEAADERIPELLRTPAAVRFLSCEPLLGPVDVSRYMWPVHWHWDAKYKTPEAARAAGAYAAQRRQALVSAHAVFLDWIIAGCESGPGARPCSVEWLRSLRDQCASAGVAFFLKQAVVTWNLDTEDQSICSMERSGTKAGGVITLPYLDGVQHAAFPEVRS